MTETSASGAPVAAEPRGNPILNLLKFGPDPLEFMTKLAQAQRARDRPGRGWAT